MKYIIVSSPNLNQFVELIQAKADEHWKPIGGPSAGNSVFIQAMVLDENEVDVSDVRRDLSAIEDKLADLINLLDSRTR